MSRRNSKIISGALALAILLSQILALHIGAEGELHISAASACVIEAESGEMLYAKHADERRGMASTTKIMTAILAIEALPQDTVVTVSDTCCGIEGSSLYLRAGEKLTLEDLLYGLLLRSANDAAVAIAIATDGSLDAFVARMNDKAMALGLKDTHFDNPHGLDGTTHYTTARELALLGAYCMKNDTFSKIVSTKRHTIAKGTDSERLLINHNRMLSSYDGAVGIKTGFTKKCGRTLIGAARREGITLISVTLDAPSDWSDHAKMLDLGFSKIEYRTVVSPLEYTYELPVIGAVCDTVRVANTEAVRRILRSGEENASVDIVLPHYLSAPIKKGERVGEIRIYYPDGASAICPIVALSDAPLKQTKKHFFSFFNLKPIRQTICMIR